MFNNFAVFDAFLVEFLVVLESIFFVLYAYFICLALNMGYLYLFCGGHSNIPTAPRVRRFCREIIRKDFENKGTPENYTIVDIGSGYGFYVRDIARYISKAKVIGVDFDPLAIRICNFLKKWMGPENSEFICADLREYNLSKADAVVLYLQVEHMQEIGEKLKAELKAGAMVICNRFALGAGWEPVKVEYVKTPRRRQGKVNIYRR